MIKIKRNPNGDTRTADKNVTFKEFQIANDMHREDVRNVMFELAMKILENGSKHDWTKKSQERLFYKNFLSTLNDGANFVEQSWYNYHINEERHHLTSKCPDDVNLLDVIEMIADCVCAGLARSGETRPLEIDNEILVRAMKNTQKYIENMIEVDDD